MATLPQHVPPMLARIGAPFDSDEHVFELKWDGVRCMAYVDDEGLRMHGRRRRDLASRYPELQFLRELPAGTLLDGELVVLREDGRPDFGAILSRENASAATVAARMSRHPVVYVVFDLLYERGESLMQRPLRERRARLAACVEAAGHQRLRHADGVESTGRLLFEAAQDRDLEGIVAKRLDSPYLPGERSDAWQKIKQVRTIHCLVLGYERAPDRPSQHGCDIRSLIVATDVDGRLECVGKVGSGIGDVHRRDLHDRLSRLPAQSPLIDADVADASDPVWVAPGIYCLVSYLERSEGGALRAPVFKGLLTEETA